MFFFNEDSLISMLDLSGFDDYFEKLKALNTQFLFLFFVKI